MGESTKRGQLSGVLLHGPPPFMLHRDHPLQAKVHRNGGLQLPLYASSHFKTLSSYSAI